MRGELPALATKMAPSATPEGSSTREGISVMRASHCQALLAGDVRGLVGDTAKVLADLDVQVAFLAPVGACNTRSSGHGVRQAAKQETARGDTHPSCCGQSSSRRPRWSRQ